MSSTSTLPSGAFDKASLELISAWRSKASRAPARPAAARRSVCRTHSSEWRDPRTHRLDVAQARPRAVRFTG